MRRLANAVASAFAGSLLTIAAMKWQSQHEHRTDHAPRITNVADPSGAVSPRGDGTPDGGPRIDFVGPSPSEEARMLHGDVRHSHRAAAVAPRAAPVLAWTCDVGGPIEAEIVASPDGQVLYVVSLAGALTALSSRDGKLAWSLPLADRSYATPYVADDGTVFVGTDGRKVLAVSSGGAIKWSLETDGDADTGFAPARDGSIVFAAGRAVYAISPQGQVKWRFSAKRKVFTAPALDPSGRIFFGSQDHHVYALSPEGRLAWAVDLGADVDASPALGDDGAVFVGTDANEVVRLDPDGGRIFWRSAVGGYVRGPLSIARNGDVLAGVYGPTPRTVRLKAADGSRVSAFSVQGTGALDFGIHGGPLEDAAGTLIFGAQDDFVYALEPTGRLLWSYATGGDVDAPVTLLRDGTLIVGSDDGIVRALRRAP